jgi:hypothetical protein
VVKKSGKSDFAMVMIKAVANVGITMFVKGGRKFQNPLYIQR